MTKKELIRTLTEAYYKEKEVELTTSTLNFFRIENEDIIDFILNETKDLSESCYNKEKDIKYVQVKIIEPSDMDVFGETTVVCENCDHVFYVDKKMLKNIEYGEYGLPFIECPYCMRKTVVDEEKALDLDENNLKYPQHFSCQKNSKHVVEIDDKEIDEQCRKTLKRLKEDKIGDFNFWATGDTAIIGLKFADEYQIIVAKKYDEVSIPNEEEEFYD